MSRTALACFGIVMLVGPITGCTKTVSEKESLLEIATVQASIDDPNAIVPDWYRSRSCVWVEKDGMKVKVSGSYNELLVSTIVLASIMYVTVSIGLLLWVAITVGLKYIINGYNTEDALCQVALVAWAMILPLFAFGLAAALSGLLYYLLFVVLGIATGAPMYVPYPFLFCLLNLIFVGAILSSPITLLSRKVRALARTSGDAEGSDADVEDANEKWSRVRRLAINVGWAIVVAVFTGICSHFGGLIGGAFAFVLSSITGGLLDFDDSSPTVGSAPSGNS